MAASWIRREFAETGVTQYPPGPKLAVAQEHFGGRALLCIDVSLSMAGDRLPAAIEGGLEFLQQATEARYNCGLVLWAGTVVEYLPTTAPLEEVEQVLRHAYLASNTLLAPALRVAIAELGPLKGDRVVCVFGDGGIFDAPQADQLAAEARALGIRFVVRGLGEDATTSLSRVLTPGARIAETTVNGVTGLREGISSMVGEVTAGRRGLR